MIPAVAAPMPLDGALRSPLDGVSNEQWTRLVHALAVDDDWRSPTRGQPRSFATVTASGWLGCFGIPPRRLVDLGIAVAARVVGERTICDFAPPMTLERFLRSPFAQRDALNESLRRYDLLAASERPVGASRSGALALFHRLGPRARVKWAEHKEPSTIALFRRANGLF